jgi:uncharacterized protein
MEIGVSGASGLIGRALCERLRAEGHSVTVYGRSRVGDLPWVEWDLFSELPDGESLAKLNAFVHLAGESIAEGRWSESRKRLIRDSRVVGTRHLVKALETAPAVPGILVSASAVGFYGNRGKETLAEESPPGNGFLADVCRSWEAEALQARRRGMRVVLTRTGMVLSGEGGALQKMLTPFRLGVGGRLGSGEQYMSWIHIEDQVGLLLHALADERIEGPLNCVSPNPVTNAEFTKILARVLRRPALFPVPATALRLAVGEMAQPLLLEGQRTFPRKALDTGFSFRFPALRNALSHLLPR